MSKQTKIWIAYLLFGVGSIGLLLFTLDKNIILGWKLVLLLFGWFFAMLSGVAGGVIGDYDKEVEE